MFFKKTFLPIILATIWISISEFVRNEVLFKSYWIQHYKELGLVFPSETINGILWGVWALLFTLAIYIIEKKFSLLHTFLISWFVGFIFMWVVIGNLGVLPFRILWFAVPLSLLEVFVATVIMKKLSK